MTPKSLLKALGLDAVYGIDFETVWADDYTLTNLPTTEYVTDKRFGMHCASVQKDSWAKAKVMNPTQFKTFVRSVNWSRTGMLAHHCHFDGLIASHHFGLKPAFYFDTLSMGKPVMPVRVGGSLNKLCQAFGLKGKVGSEALLNTKGKTKLTRDEYKALSSYAGNDCEEMWMLFNKLLPFIPVDELRIIDATIKMYAQPSLLLDAEAIARVLDADVAAKEALRARVGVPKSHLTSKDKFAELLRKAGVEPPTKISAKQSEKVGYDVEVLAMSKQDQEFKDLLAHENPKVRELVEARFSISSNQMESRCKRLISRAPLGPQPVYLNYYGAKTGRWSGGDSANWQNLSSKRKEGGAELRASVHAPPGHMLIIADLAQIEARVNCWFSGQKDVIEAFRAYDAGEGPDIYRLTAANDIYNKPIDKVTDSERFVGKTCELGLGFQAGAPRFAAMLRIGALGPPVDITDAHAKDIHAAWRQARPFIVAGWKATNNKVKSAFVGKQQIEDGVVVYQGAGDVGWMHLPGGMAIRYDGLQFEEDGSYSYISKYRANKFKEPTVERTRLYGGILVENRTQALARQVIAGQMIEIMDVLKSRVRIAMSTHDEIVGVVPIRSANRALSVFKEVMSRPPSWAPDLPLAVDAHISERYDK